MGISNDIQNIRGVVTVQIEGFFTERFINLCKINNIKIWDIRNLVKGVIRFKISIKDFKKLRMVARKTKCSVKIKKKEGLYFMLFKYRKRKMIVFLLCLAVFFTIAFSTFIWNIEISGNENISRSEVIENLKKSGLYVGRCKIGLDKKEVINNLRVNMQDISWVGIEIDGTLATIKLVEKTKLDEKDIQNDKIGDIIAKKDGVITRIVPENGTAMINEKSYVESGTVLIQGRMYSKFLEPFDVTASGIVKADCEYTYEKMYYFNNIEREYTGKKMYTIGISVNSKENMLNYLNKSKKYDISKNSKCFKIFGQEISFDWYKCLEYNEIEIIKTKEDIINEASICIDEYYSTHIIPNANNAVLADKKIEYVDKEDGILLKVTYIVNEEIGEFVERNNDIANEQEQGTN